MDQNTFSSPVKSNAMRFLVVACLFSEVAGQEQAALEAGSYAVLTKAVLRADLLGKLPEVMNYSDKDSEEENEITFS